MNQNPILDTDSYKVSHYLQYPPGTCGQFNYLESRGGQYQTTVFFGLQYLLMEYLTTPVTMEHVKEAAEFFEKHGLPFNRKGWERLVLVHGGYLPLRIKAVPEGMVVPTRSPLLTCEATDGEFFWLVGWFETVIMRLWYPITVATLSFHVKHTIKRFMEETCDSLDGLEFKLHDFGSRGVSSRESAAIGGAAHLVNFGGSDTIAGIAMANKYYMADMAGYSIPAAEHSTITSWGREHEVDAYRNMLKQFAKPGAVLAVVSDSYNIYNACEELWGEKLRQEVIDSGATVVIRPDSGDPVTVVNTIMHTLERKFGSTKNSKGYRVLNHVRVIQGDGVNPITIERVLTSLKQAGFSADNITFGMGGALLQQVNRDTLKFAYKCSSIDIIDDETGEMTERDVFKDPIDDKGKRSKAGRIGLGYSGPNNGYFYLTGDMMSDNILEVVFENGTIMKTYSLQEVRDRASQAL